MLVCQAITLQGFCRDEVHLLQLIVTQEGIEGELRYLSTELAENWRKMQPSSTRLPNVVTPDGISTSRKSRNCRAYGLISFKEDGSISSVSPEIDHLVSLIL